MNASNKITNNDAGIPETNKWHQIYNTDSLANRRRNSMPKKLHKLGLNKSQIDSAMLDTCCGHGEALDSLYNMGFRKLFGTDICIPILLKNDKRFHLVEADASMAPFHDNHFDIILNLHALHHISEPQKIAAFMKESERLLKPGGKLCIVDFSDSLPIRLAFWWFLQRKLLWNDYLLSFANLIEEEWPILQLYFKNWPIIKNILYDNKFKILHHRHDFFYFYLQLENIK